MTMLSGGWEFIRAAYIAPWIAFGVYGLALWIRWRRLQKTKS